MIIVNDVSEGNIDDVFRVCSHSRLDDPLQRKGMKIKRKWLLRMLAEYGPCTKIAYLDRRPVAQILFYPEEAVPFLPKPREGAIALNCTYNPFLETRGKGVASSLVRSLVDDARAGLKCLRWRPCSFIAAKQSEISGGPSMVEFYTRAGFSKAKSEMFLEISGDYKPKGETAYKPTKEDKGRAIMFYDSTCEWGYGSAIRVRDLIHSVEPGYPFDMIDPWEKPVESTRRGNQRLIVNGKTIHSSRRDKEAFLTEIKNAVRGS